MKKGKVLGLDYGSKRVGLATGDLEDGIAFPRDVILNKGIEGLITKIVSFCEKWGIVLIVVGLPLKMEGYQADNKVLTDVRYFVEKLRNFLGDSVKVEFFDERLSTFEADQLIKSVVGFGRHKIGRDAYAAQIILQRFFDRNKNSGVFS